MSLTTCKAVILTTAAPGADNKATSETLNIEKAVGVPNFPVGAIENDQHTVMFNDFIVVYQHNGTSFVETIEFAVPVPLGAIPEYSTRTAAALALGSGKLFRYTEVPALGAAHDWKHGIDVTP